MTTRRLTVGQAVVQFLKQQSVERDGERHPFFAGMFGIFGHGNVAGLGQALEQDGDLRYYQARSEQGMVHAAVAFAKQHRRLRAFACTSSIGPGATNMVTGAALATISHLPVLLLPGDLFARRNVAPVLQQLEAPWTQDISVNDCFKPVSRYWDRINRPEQLITALPEALRVLTDPAETGAVTLCLPQDVQAEACEFPEELFAPRTHVIRRAAPDATAVRAAVALIVGAERPLVIAGGGLIYSQAEPELAALCGQTGMPVGETQAGKGALGWLHPNNLGAIGHTGTTAANRIAADADVVICIGTRLSDFTTASRTLFRNPHVRFIGINVTAMDAAKHSALPMVADARAALTALCEALAAADYRVSKEYSGVIAERVAEWKTVADRARTPAEDQDPGPLSQAQVIGVVNEAMAPNDVVLGAAGSLPGDMHKLWRPADGDQYHVEYGYSCMGYEIAGGLGVRLANADGEVFVMCGDGSFLMLHGELVTALQERQKLIVILVDSHGFRSIHGLSLACGSRGFGNEFRMRDAKTDTLEGDVLPIDYADLARALGAYGVHVKTRAELIDAVADARASDTTTVIVVEIDPRITAPDSGAWWDVPVAEISDMSSVQAVRRDYVERRDEERHHL